LHLHTHVPTRPITKKETQALHKQVRSLKVLQHRCGVWTEGNSNANTCTNKSDVCNEDHPNANTCTKKSDVCNEDHPNANTCTNKSDVCNEHDPNQTSGRKTTEEPANAPISYLCPHQVRHHS
jgi:hypothetical protein